MSSIVVSHNPQKCSTKNKKISTDKFMKTLVSELGPILLKMYAPACPTHKKVQSVFACVLDDSLLKSNVYKTVSLMSNIRINVQH